MSGFISINKDKFWSAANWVHRAAVDDARKFIDKDRFPNLDSLMNEDENVLLDIDFECLTKEEIKEFSRAVILNYKEYLEQNGASFASQEFLQDLLEDLQS